LQTQLSNIIPLVGADESAAQSTNHVSTIDFHYQRMLRTLPPAYSSSPTRVLARTNIRAEQSVSLPITNIRNLTLLDTRAVDPLLPDYSPRLPSKPKTPARTSFTYDSKNDTITSSDNSSLVYNITPSYGNAHEKNLYRILPPGYHPDIDDEDSDSNPIEETSPTYHLIGTFLRDVSYRRLYRVTIPESPSKPLGGTVYLSKHIGVHRAYHSPPIPKILDTSIQLLSNLSTDVAFTFKKSSNEWKDRTGKVVAKELCMGAGAGGEGKRIVLQVNQGVYEEEVDLLVMCWCTRLWFDGVCHYY